MRGRKPKPIPLRLIEGNREHRTIHPELVPKPKSDKPPLPKCLNPTAKRHWKYLLKQLSGMNTLAESDQGTIMAAALAFSQVCDLQQEIEELMGATAPDDCEDDLAGLRRLLNATSTNLVKFEAELGLNPTSRSRIKLDTPQAKSRKERLLG